MPKKRSSLQRLGIIFFFKQAAVIAKNVPGGMGEQKPHGILCSLDVKSESGVRQYRPPLLDRCGVTGNDGIKLPEPERDMSGGMAGGSEHLTSSAKRQQLTLPKRPIDRDRFNRAEELAESLAERLLLFRQPALQPLRLLKTKRFFVPET
jgi:hypothetical protein